VPVYALVRKALGGRQSMELVDRQRRRLRRLLAVCVVAVPARGSSRQIQGWGLMAWDISPWLVAITHSVVKMKKQVMILQTGTLPVVVVVSFCPAAVGRVDYRTEQHRADLVCQSVEG
jgi:hypothetical protein